MAGLYLEIFLFFHCNLFEYFICKNCYNYYHTNLLQKCTIQVTETLFQPLRTIKINAANRLNNLSHSKTKSKTDLNIYHQKCKSSSCQLKSENAA